MQLPTLEIHSTDAYIGMSSHRPGPRISQPSADLQIRQQHVGMIEISQTAAKLFIDQRQAFAEANLKTPLRMANDYWNKTTSVVHQYLAKKAQQGDQMMKIENGARGGAAFAQIAKVNGERAPQKAVYTTMPRSAFSISFDYQPGQLSMKAPYKEPDITVTPRPPQIEMPKWQLDVYLRQKNNISFQAVGTEVNMGL
ncbi:DUF6470 family protein [Halalkalibacter oceani]|uniref:DUF6470 family protein n=1 Tax=Halalkalibacter oceani TaxID=1653776 RepID=A0A9X2DS55_9BACI|nr:DUF6470 family protein [Halalkalibacter oceani]MCM3716126.1 DUF6470 family protein [Halalkalibacter oceani]